MDANSNKDEIQREMDALLESGSGPKLARFALACLGGLIPYAGGAVGGAASSWSESDAERFNRLLRSWMKLQEEEIKEIGKTLFEVFSRLDHSNEEIRKRIESPAYLSLVKKCFRDWSAAESEEKRVLIRNLLTNAASTQITKDDVIRLFIEWIEKYSEAHFRVIREIYKTPQSTRGDVWDSIHGIPVREDSAEADIFKTLIHDLSVGHIIRQFRQTDYHGNFVKNQVKRKTANRSSMTSAFDDEKPYVLTELGQQFVHYTMTEVTVKIESKNS